MIRSAMDKLFFNYVLKAIKNSTPKLRNTGCSRFYGQKYHEEQIKNFQYF